MPEITALLHFAHLHQRVFAKYPESWNLDPCIKQALTRPVATSGGMSYQLTLGQPDHVSAVPDADVARVAVRDGLDLLLRSLNTRADGSHTPGTHGLVTSAKVGVPFATHALDGVVLMDIPGTADPHALHVHETRIAVGKTRLAVLVLPAEKGRPIVLPGDAVAELHHSGFLRSMLLAKADDEYDLVVVVNADTQSPARAEQAGELGQLRVAIMKEVRSVATTLLPKAGEDVAEGGPTKDSLLARMAVVERRLTVVYLRARHAAAAVLGYVNSNLRADYCADPRGNFGAGPGCVALPVVPSQTEDEVKATVEATGVPRLLELLSAVRSDAVPQLRSVLNGALHEIQRGIMDIDRQTVVLPQKLFDCFEKWSANELSKKRGACGACLGVVLLSRAPRRFAGPATSKVTGPGPRTHAKIIAAFRKCLVDQVPCKLSQKAKAQRKQLVLKHLGDPKDWLDVSKVRAASGSKLRAPCCSLKLTRHASPLACSVTSAYSASAACCFRRWCPQSQRRRSWPISCAPRRRSCCRFACVPACAGVLRADKG